MQSDVSIIIANWNTSTFLTCCLQSLPSACGSLDYEVWVVDNASADGSPALIRERFSQVKLIANPRNIGFAAANNQACRQTRGRYLLLLNPDTQSTPGSIAGLVAYADTHPEIGALGPRLLNSDGSTQRSCWRGYPGIGMALVNAFYLWKLPWFPLTWVSDYRSEELKSPRTVDHLLGACILIRRSAWEQVGYLDESYFLGSEETDWCYRARHAGWQIVYHPDFRIIHHGQKSTWQQPVVMLPQMYSGVCGFYRKYHRSRIGLSVLCIVLWLGALVRVGLWTMRSMVTVDQGHHQVADNMIRGYVQVMRLLPRELSGRPSIPASIPRVTAPTVDER